MQIIDIDITPKAADFLKKSLLTSNTPNVGIRLLVKNSGCSGKSYQVDFAIELKDDDLKFETNNLCIIIDPESYLSLKGIQLDLEVQGVNEFLRFNNPNAINICGCGESFQLKSDQIT